MIDGDLLSRTRGLISHTWKIFTKKVGSGIININKEASMQLHYAYILQDFLDSIRFNKSEKIQLELETGVSLNGKQKEIDILVKVIDKDLIESSIAIEMKCYRTKTSAGKPRGAQDVFKKDIYIDLELLEGYTSNRISNIGVGLIMTDHYNFVNPKSKDAKSWDYDISQDASIISGIHLDTQIGGNPVKITLQKSYIFNWVNEGKFWFLELEGK